MRIHKMYDSTKTPSGWIPPGRLDNVNTRLLIPSHALPPTFLCLCIKSGLDFYERANARFWDPRKARLRKRREAPDALDVRGDEIAFSWRKVDVRGEQVASSRKGVELRARMGPTPPFLCKCSFCESCTRGLRKLEADDWGRFPGRQILNTERTETRRAQRERRRFE
jgi:hypothetical protein